MKNTNHIIYIGICAILTSRMGEQGEHESIEKMENINQTTKTLYLFTKTLYFAVFMSTVEKIIKYTLGYT